MIISEESKREINWWIKTLKDYNGKIIRPSAPQIYIESDASLIGWEQYLKMEISHKIPHKADGMLGRVCYI